MQKENKDLIKQNSDLNSELDKIYKQNDQLKKENNNLKKENSEFNSELEDVYKENDKLKEENEILKNNEKEYIKNEKLLNERESELYKREEEFNKKRNYLDDQERSIENDMRLLNKDKEENKRIKQENINLMNKNRELEKEIKEKQLQYDKLVSNINKQNQINIKNNFNPEKEIKKSNLFRSVSYTQKSKKINPLDEYSAPTLIGLNNIGATCFMNSTLQCLSQTKELTNYFLNEKNEDNILNNNLALEDENSLQLCPVYLDLIHSLWSKTNKRPISPNEFMETVEAMNSLFKQGQAGDSKDFIIFILEQFHKELKKSVRKDDGETKLPLNQYDKENTFNNFFDDFKGECSIISDTFFGFNETTNVCLNCKNIYNSKGLQNPICYNYGIFNVLIFPLEEVKNMKNNSMQINNSIQINNNRVSLYECFFYNQKTDLFTGQNRNYCNICKQLYDSEYTCRIFSSPIVLILILNRGKDNMYNVKLDFDEKIDLTNFVIMRDTNNLIYELYGVITHIGQSGPNAHFVATCKSPIDHRWYRYNDAMVHQINNLQKELFDFGTPYILFYRKA